LNLPAVTVVIPTRDRPELLREAVDSVLRQTYDGNIQTIVVHDGSGAVPDVEGSGAARRVEVIRNSRSEGLAGARNTGILAADTPLVAFCDDDDAWLPNKLVKQVAALEAQPRSVVISCGIRVRNAAAGTSTDRVTESPSVSFRQLLRDRYAELHSSTLLLRTQELRGRVGLVDESVPGSFGEDYDLLLRAARIAPILVVQEVLTEVRWHGASFFFERWRMMLEALTWLLERYPEFESEPVGFARVAGQVAVAAAASGERQESLRWAGRAFRHNPREPRVGLALAVASRLVTAEQVMAWLNARGRGI